MIDKLIEYGFKQRETGWLLLEKNGWGFSYSPHNNYMWVVQPNASYEDGICVRNLTYDKIINLVEFIHTYE